MITCTISLTTNPAHCSHQIRNSITGHILGHKGKVKIFFKKGQNKTERIKMHKKSKEFVYFLWKQDPSFLRLSQA